MVFGFQFYEFFLRMLVNLARRVGSNNWPVLTAIVSKSEANRSFWGCIIVSIHYKYRNADERFAGTHSQPFIFQNYAHAYLRRFPGGSEFPVRVDSRHPSRSIPEKWKIKFTRVG